MSTRTTGVAATEVHPNPFAANHEPGQIPQYIGSLGADVVVAGGMGSKAIEWFRQFGIAVATGARSSVAETLDAYLARCRCRRHAVPPSALSDDHLRPGPLAASGAQPRHQQHPAQGLLLLLRLLPGWSDTYSGEQPAGVLSAKGNPAQRGGAARGAGAARRAGRLAHLRPGRRAHPGYEPGRGHRPAEGLRHTDRGDLERLAGLARRRPRRIGQDRLASRSRSMPPTPRSGDR